MGFGHVSSHLGGCGRDCAFTRDNAGIPLIAAPRGLKVKLRDGTPDPLSVEFVGTLSSEAHAIDAFGTDSVSRTRQASAVSSQSANEGFVASPLDTVRFQSRIDPFVTLSEGGA